jgi:anti-anti-sigma factor
MFEMRESAWFEAFVAHHDGSAVVMVRGDADLGALASFTAAVDEALTMSRDVVLDMADVTFLDSSGLRVILTAALRVPEGGSVIVRNAQPNVEHVLHLSGVDTAVIVEPLR